MKIAHHQTEDIIQKNQIIIEMIGKKNNQEKIDLEEKKVRWIL